MHAFGITHSCVRYDSFTTRPSKFKTVPQCSKIMAIRIDHPNLNKQFSHQAHLLSKRTFCLSSPVVPLHLFISRILYPHTPHSVGSTRCGRAAGLGSNIAQNQNTALTLRGIVTFNFSKIELELNNLNSILSRSAMTPVFPLFYPSGCGCTLRTRPCSVRRSY